jgi:hypothetical protein
VARRVLVLTHKSLLTDPEIYYGERDLYIVDEHNDPVMVKSFTQDYFSQIRDAEHKTFNLNPVFQDAVDWVHKAVSEAGQNALEAPEVPDLALDDFDIKTEKGTELKEFCEYLKAGKVFLKYQLYPVFTLWDYKFQHEDKTILFSATAKTEGWHYNPKGLEILDGPEVCYSKTHCVRVNRPDGLPSEARKVTNNQTRALLHEKIVGLCNDIPDQKILVITKEMLRDDLEEALSVVDKNVSVINYGRHLGSNEFRECTAVVLVYSWDQKASVLQGNYLGHAGYDTPLLRG